MTDSQETQARAERPFYSLSQHCHEVYSPKHRVVSSDSSTSVEIAIATPTNATLAPTETVRASQNLEVCKDHPEILTVCGTSTIARGSSIPQTTLSPQLNREQNELLLPMQHQASYANLSQRLTRILIDHCDPETVLLETVRALGETFQSDGCILAVWPNPQTLPHIVYWQANHIEILSHSQTAILDHPAIQQILTSSHLQAISDISKLKLGKQTQDTSQSPPIQAVLGITTQFQGKRNGFVGLVRSQPHPWTSTEMDGIQTISDQVAVAISQAHLQRQSHQQALRQSLIDRLTMATRNASDISQILKLAAEGTAQALQADRGMMIMLKYSDPLRKSRAAERTTGVRATVAHDWEQSNDFTQTDPFSFPKEPPKADNLPSFWLSECSLCQQVFADASKLLVIADQHTLTSTDPTIGIAPIFCPDALPAILIAPLESQGTVLGMLVLQHHQPHHWQPEEIELVELVSAQVSTAIIQTQTLRQVQALVEERTIQLQRSLEVQAKLYEKTRQQIDQLRHLNQLKDEFLSTVSHELLTPLTSMTLAIRMLRQPGLSQERYDRYLEILERQCLQETNLINDLLALQKLESKQTPVQLQKVDLKHLIKDLAQCFEEKWADKGLNLNLELPERSLMIQTDCDSLNRILLELLTNAGKYSEPNCTIHLQLAQQTHVDNNGITLTLCNIGAGISAEEMPYIFDKFRRGQGVTQQAIQGTGLGLALVKCLVQHLNGTITVASHPLNHRKSYETCFTLNLPSFLTSTSV